MVSLRTRLVLVVALIAAVQQCCWACSKVPEFNGRAVTKEKKSGDNGYRLAVRNDPSGYEAGKIYNCNFSPRFLSQDAQSRTFTTLTLIMKDDSLIIDEYAKRNATSSSLITSGNGEAMAYVCLRGE